MPPPPPNNLTKKLKTSENKCNLDIFESYYGTLLQWSIRRGGGGGERAVENNNNMQKF